MTATFQFDPVKATTALARMSLAPDSIDHVALAGDDLGQGVMGALVQAELMAARAGVVPLVPSAAGLGIVNVGGARALVDKMPPDVKILYLATHGTARRINAGVKLARPGVPQLGGSAISDLVTDVPNEIGNVPVVIALVCLGIAVALAGASIYESHAKIVEVEAQNLRTTARLATLTKAAELSIQSTGKIAPEILSAIGRIPDIAAAEERRSSSIGGALAIGAGVLLAGGGGAYFAHRKGWI